MSDPRDNLDRRPGPGLYLLSVVFAVSGLIGAALLFRWAEVSAEVSLIIIFVLGLIVLFTVLGLFVVGFRSQGLTSNKQALALPEGSIRALLALILVLAFVFTSVYLVERVYLVQGEPNEAAQDIAQILISVLGTLVTAAAAFYFGANAVRSGAAVTAQAIKPPTPGPTAATKGNEPPADGKVTLVGFVNPRGRETQWFFQYGETLEYGSSTPPQTLGVGEKDQLIKAEIDHTGELHVRTVAYNEGGLAYGDDHTIPAPDAPIETVGDPEPEEPEEPEEAEELEAAEEDEEAAAPEAPPLGAELETEEDIAEEPELSDDDLEVQPWENEVDELPEEPAGEEKPST